MEKIELTLTLAEEGGYCVTSTTHPELHSQGETLEEALTNAGDALRILTERDY